MVTILHAVDTLMRIAVFGQKGMVEDVISTVVRFLDELGHQRVLLKSDNEPSVTALTHEVSRRWHADNDRTTTIEEIPTSNSQGIGEVR